MASQTWEHIFGDTLLRDADLLSSSACFSVNKGLSYSFLVLIYSKQLQSVPAPFLTFRFAALAVGWDIGLYGNSMFKFSFNTHSYSGILFLISMTMSHVTSDGLKL